MTVIKTEGRYKLVADDHGRYTLMYGSRRIRGVASDESTASLEALSRGRVPLVPVGPLTIYVPAHDSHLRKTVLAGSAMVGSPATDDSDRVVVDYEGNRYGSSSMASFEDKLLHAAGRHLERYPTVARVQVDSSQLIPVGTYDFDTRSVDVTDQAALDEWSTP